MPLIPCPDCGREVSTSAPACIHCGRPLAEPASAAVPRAAVPSAASATQKPMPGIVTALVLGVLSIVWLMQRNEPATPEAQDVATIVNTVHMLGTIVLIIGALLALAGHRAAHGMIRGLSFVMIVAICVAMRVVWNVTAPLLGETEGEVGRGLLGGIVVISTVFQLSPWMLYLYLFRKSRYP